MAEAGYSDGFKVRGILMNVFGFPESADFMQALEVYFRDVGIELKLEAMRRQRVFNKEC